MKKFTFLFLFFCTASAAMAQITRGHFLVGGNISFESIENRSTDINYINYKTTNLFISPNAGYFFINKLAGGIRVDLKIFKQKAPYYGLSQTNFSFSPFLRYYFLSAKNKLNVFADASYIHSSSRYKSPGGPSSTEKTNGYYVSAGPSVFLTSHVSLDFFIGYRHTITKDFYHTQSNIFNSGLGLQVHLGKIKHRI